MKTFAKITLVVVAGVSALVFRDAGAFSKGASKMHFDRSKRDPFPKDTLVIPKLGCVKSVGPMHLLRRLESIAPEGDREKPQPQDKGWAPEAISDLAIRGNQYVFVDRASARISISDSAFTNRREFGTKGNGPGEFQSLFAVAFDPRGDTLWVLDNGRHVAAAFTTAGRFVREVRVSPSARDIAVGSDGAIYVSNEVAFADVVGTAPLVTMIGRTSSDTMTVVSAKSGEFRPPRFVVPGGALVRVKALGAYVAVYYAPAGVVELYAKGGAGLKLVSTINSCMNPQLADAYARQRTAHSNPNKFVSLATDVTIRGDTIYVINNRETKDGQYGIQRFHARTGADLGAIVMNGNPVKLPYELRFGNTPTEIVSFSEFSGMVIRFDASRRISP